MCGIAAFIPAQDIDDEIDGARRQFTHLLMSAQTRGWDAAGVMIVNGADIDIAKHNGPVDEFVRLVDYERHLKKFDEHSDAIVGHARYATYGDPCDIDNAHPVHDADIAIVHNGQILNHLELRERFDVLHEVDTSGLLAAIRHHSPDRLTGDSLLRSTYEVAGPVAVIAADRRADGAIYAFRNEHAPLVFTIDRRGLWLASTIRMLRLAGLNGAIGDLKPGRVYRLGRKRQVPRLMTRAA